MYSYLGLYPCNKVNLGGGGEGEGEGGHTHEFAMLFRSNVSSHRYCSCVPPKGMERQIDINSINKRALQLIREFSN